MRLPRSLSLALLTTAAAVLPVASAHAGILVASATNCDSESLSQPFAPWHDSSSYTLAPGGAAESSDGWTLTGGAGVSAGNEPWNVNSATDSSSLSLPSGSSATTDTMCVGLNDPTLRLFAHSTGTDQSSSLRTDVIFKDVLGYSHALRIGSMSPTSGNWTPTPIMPIIANFLVLTPNEQTPVSFRFTPVGSGSWEIDDVYVDPWGNR